MIADIKNAEKLFEGSYEYRDKRKMYSQENFKVFQPFDTDLLVYHAEILTRCPNGEFLKIYVTYTINSEHLPVEVIIRKELGVLNVEEIFRPMAKNQQFIDYTFKSNGKRVQIEEFQVPTGRYHISTPATTCALIFLGSKKYDPTKRNSYSMVRSENDWEYATGNLKHAHVYLETENQAHTGSEEIMVKGVKRECRKYLYFEQIKQEVIKGKKETPDEIPVVFYISEHVSLPYLVEFNDGIVVEVGQLKDLQNHDAKEFFKNFGKMGA